MAWSTAWSFVTEVAVVLGAIVSVLTILRVVDRYFDNRLREWLREYVGQLDVKRGVEQNEEKIDQLHRDHQRTMGVQVAVVETMDELVDAICEADGVEVDNRPDDLDVERIRRQAMESGATWPGEFRRGPDGPNHPNPSDD